MARTGRQSHHKQAPNNNVRPVEQASQLALFATTPSTNPIVGLRVRLDRDIDRRAPCHDNLAVIGSSSPSVHHASLRCSTCGAFRGWVGAAMADFVTKTMTTFGPSEEPIILRTIETEKPMAKPAQGYDNRNRGALFRNEKKQGDRDPDYSGNIDVDGQELRISGWIKTSKSGTKYMSLAVTAKERAP